MDDYGGQNINNRQFIPDPNNYSQLSNRLVTEPKGIRAMGIFSRSLLLASMVCHGVLVWTMALSAD